MIFILFRTLLAEKIFTDFLLDTFCVWILLCAIVCYYSVTFWQKSGASKSCLFYDCVHLNLDSLKFLLYTIAQWCFHMWQGSNDLNSHYISSISSPLILHILQNRVSTHLAFFSAKIPLVFGIWIHICNSCGFHSALHWTY